MLSLAQFIRCISNLIMYGCYLIAGTCFAVIKTCWLVAKTSVFQLSHKGFSVFYFTLLFLLSSSTPLIPSSPLLILLCAFPPATYNFLLLPFPSFLSFSFYNHSFFYLSPQFLCTVVAILLHYFFMSTFAWMFVEGLHIYRMQTEQRNINYGAMRFYYAIGWGVPAIITGDTVVWTRQHACRHTSRDVA